MTWTAAIVAERMAAAARTLRASQTVARAPAQLRSAMPDYVRSREEAYGYSEATPGRADPAAAALRALDQVMNWLSSYLNREACARAGLAADAGKIAWLRAGGSTWPRIATMRVAQWAPMPPAGGNSRESLRLIAQAAHEHVARCLTRDRVALSVGAAGEPEGPAPLATGDHHTLPRHIDGRHQHLNAYACGLCAWIEAAGSAHRCRRGLGAVSPTLRARHPAGEPCFEPVPVEVTP